MTRFPRTSEIPEINLDFRPDVLDHVDQLYVIEYNLAAEVASCFSYDDHDDEADRYAALSAEVEMNADGDVHRSAVLELFESGVTSPDRIAEFAEILVIGEHAIEHYGLRHIKKLVREYRKDPEPYVGLVLACLLDALGEVTEDSLTKRNRERSFNARAAIERLAS